MEELGEPPQLDDRLWWEDEDDWSEDLYYNTLADYFHEKWEEVVKRYGLDCE